MYQGDFSERYLIFNIFFARYFSRFCGALIIRFDTFILALLLRKHCLLTQNDLRQNIIRFLISRTLKPTQKGESIVYAEFRLQNWSVEELIS